MNKFIKALIEKFNKKYKSELERQKKFFKKPDVLIALGVASLLLLNNMIKEKKTKDDLKKQLRNNKVAKDILDYTSTDFNDDSLSELLLKCLNGESDIKFPSGMEASDFLSFVDKNNDIDSKINYTKLKQLSDKLGNAAPIMLSSYFILEYIVDMTKDLLIKSEHPSKYRTKYIQKLTRNTYGLLKMQDKGNNEQTKKSLNFLKQIDNILIAIGLATTIYIANRVILRKKSKQTLDEISKDITCSSSIEPFDVSINKIPFQFNLDCPVITDDELVPHIPIELKLTNLECETNFNEENVMDASVSTDLVTHAIVRNAKQDKMFAAVSLGSHLTPESQIAIINGKVIYSPVIGTIAKISENEIILQDISDPDEDYLTTQINLLNDNYKRLNGVKSFIKEHYINSIYPQMLGIAILDDTSTFDLIPGVIGVFNETKSKFNVLNNDYENTIKKITGTDNIKQNAKNETLYKIKDDVEEADALFFKNITALVESVFATSIIIKPKPSEYELFEYYFLDLGMPLNTLNEPTEIEIQFRDIINEFARKRFVIDGYNKDKIANKINSLIKDIEKGTGFLGNLGNWFDKAMEQYNVHKQLSDVKLWLTGLANENKKLTGDKIITVNKVMFLFEFYLGADQLITKYNIVIEKDTRKKETILEGNKLQLFSQNLFTELNSLPINIEEIQKVIDSLSIFETFSIITWQGYQTRLYTLSDDTICVSDEKNDYLNPKSKKGFGDIEYWLKYCVFATLASVANPATGWSTGWIIPSPILMPVVYIPVKAISTQYGFIVLGISICGMWVFPWSLFVNYSPKHTTPFGDPTAALKREITAMKKEISEALLKLKRSVVKKMLDETGIKINMKEKDITNIKIKIAEHQTIKPKKTVSNKNGIKNNVNYLSEVGKWVETNVSLREQLLTTKIERFTLTKKYQILNSAYKNGDSVKGVDGIEQTEKMLNKKLDNLIGLIDKVDLTLAALPISLKPNTANFGFTLKNSKPVIKIADELDDNVNEGAVNTIFEKFELKNEDMMSSGFVSKLSTKMTNFKAYKKVLSTSSLLTVTKDPFPKYSLLTITNIQWQKFLYQDFVKVGAQCFGFPGNNPMPI